jgi:DNA-binding FadR family transcriptional regulator
MSDRSPRVLGLLGDLIATRNLQPGDRLPPIRELATHFGLKAGVVRDALLEAQGKGIVKVIPRAGAFVQMVNSATAAAASEPTGTRLRELLASHDINLLHLLDARETLELELIARAVRERDLQDLFLLRRILEGMVAIPIDERSANYVRLDVQFHLEIAQLSGNAVMASMLRTVMEEFEPHLLRLRWWPERRVRTDDSHARLYSNLVAGDVAAAQDEVRTHMQEAYNSMLAELRQPPKLPGSA